MNKPGVSVVIPVYGCQKALMELYERLKKNLVSVFNSYEIILVNDHCPQNSWETINTICKKDKNVIGINLSRNFGQMKAILAGLDVAKGNYIIVMDCDLQDRPEEIRNLYDKLKQGYDVVFAKRKKRKDKATKIKISKTFYKLYSLATGQKYDPSLCNFSIVKKNVIANYCKMREEHRSYVMYLQWMGYDHATIDVVHDERKEGKSSYTLKKRMKYAFDILISQSDALLKTIMGFGIIISLLSLLAIIIIVVLHFTSNLETGWPSLIVAICLMGGINVFSIGVVGLYVGNTYMQVKNRPLYFIKDIINSKENKND